MLSVTSIAATTGPLFAKAACNLASEAVPELTVAYLVILVPKPLPEETKRHFDLTPLYYSKFFFKMKHKFAV
jgi:hypothetical protein